MFEASENVKSSQQHQKLGSSQNESSVSTTTTQNDQANAAIIECSLLHCDESPMAAHYGELEGDPQHRHSRRVVAPLIQEHLHLASSSDPPKSLKRGLGLGL